MKRIINLTPHPITLLIEGQKPITLQKCDTPPRLKQETVHVEYILGVPISETKFGEVQNLPEQRKGIFLIVSRLVLTACPNRTDLLVPNELVRNENGRIVGCKSLARN